MYAIEAEMGERLAVERKIGYFRLVILIRYPHTRVSFKNSLSDIIYQQGTGILFGMFVIDCLILSGIIKIQSAPECRNP